MRIRDGACKKYVKTPLHELQLKQMCVPYLYAFIKLYGRDEHVFELAKMLKLRRRLLVPLYRTVIATPQIPMIPTFFGRRDFERDVDFPALGGDDPGDDPGFGGGPGGGGGGFPGGGGGGFPGGRRGGDDPNNPGGGGGGGGAEAEAEAEVVWRW